MQALARIADFVGQAAFDVHVDIFQIQRPFDFAGFDFCQNLGHPLSDGIQVGCGQHAGLAQHLGMGE